MSTLHSPEAEEANLSDGELGLEAGMDSDDEDGLGGYVTPETIDEVYLNATDTNEEAEGENAGNQALGSYIKDIFEDGELLGEGIEPSWKLNGSQSQTLSYDKWTTFQALFMERWEGFSQQNIHDTFWVDHQPAFHTYDHGANIEIEVNDPLCTLPKETCLRTESEDEDSDSDSDNDHDHDHDHYDDNNGHDYDNDNDYDYDNEYSNNHHQNNNDDDTTSESIQSGQGHEQGLFVDEEDGELVPGYEATDQTDVQRALYSDGLEQLRLELERKYDLNHVD
ncbi:Fc.00g073300.m01.CDS01 [Cosmosporella sp. VM-42]